MAAVVNLVKERNAPLSDYDELGRTPLTAASEAGHIEIVIEIGGAM